MLSLIFLVLLKHRWITVIERACSIFFSNVRSLKCPSCIATWSWPWIWSWWCHKRTENGGKVGRMFWAIEVTGLRVRDGEHSLHLRSVQSWWSLGGERVFVFGFIRFVCLSTNSFLLLLQDVVSYSSSNNCHFSIPYCSLILDSLIQ